METDELKKLIKQLLIEIIEENTKTKDINVNIDLVSLDVAHEILLHKFYKKSYLYELVMKSKIPHHKVGNFTYFSMAELEEWIKHKKPKV